MPTITWNNELLLSSPKIPEKATEQPWFDSNTPKTCWIYGEKRCIPLDEYIYTPDGVVQVKNVYEGMPLLGGCVKDPYVFEDEVYEVEIGSNKFIANGEHPLWVTKHSGADHKTPNGQWIRIEDIFNHYENKKSKDSIWWSYRYKSNNFEFNTISIGKKFARLLGYLMSDGYWSREQSVKFTNVNRDLLEDFAEIAVSVGQEYEFGVKEYVKGKGVDMMLTRHGNFNNGSPLKNKLRELGVIDRDTLGKILLLEKDELIEFVKTFFNGDGLLVVGERIIRIHFFLGIHKKQAYEFQFILWRLGINSFVTYELKDGINYKGCWEIQVSRRKEVEKLLNILEDRKYPEKFHSAKALLKTMSKSMDSQEDMSGDWITINKIKKIGKKRVMGWKTDPSSEIISYNGLKTHNSGKGVVIDKVARLMRNAGFGLTFHLYSADGYENCYYAYNNSCKEKWDGWRRSTEESLRDILIPLKDRYVPNLNSLSIDDTVFSIYEQKNNANESDVVKMKEMLSLYNKLENEGLHCNCIKPVPILWMYPEYGNIPQWEINRYNGTSWKNYDEYHNAYLTGSVDDYLPNEPWIDVSKLVKPQKLRPKTELIKIQDFPLPMESSSIEEFRVRFRDMVNLARNEHRILVNTQQCYPTDRTGKKEKYTVLAEIFKYFPTLSQTDFAKLTLEKPREEWSNWEKSWHKIGLLANEVREFAPSAKLSGDDEAKVSKKAFFNFVPKIRHHKAWFYGDLQAPADLETGVRIQDDYQIIKRNTERRLGDDLADFYNDVENTYRKMLLQYSGEEFIDNVGYDIMEFVKGFNPRIPDIPDNKGYVLYGNGLYKLITFDMQSWHHKSDRDSFAEQTGIHYTLKDERKMIDDKGENIVSTKKTKKSKMDRDDMWTIIEKLKDVDKMDWQEIINYFIQKDKDNGIEDSKWKQENPKNLSNKYGYYKKSKEKQLLNKMK